MSIFGTLPFVLKNGEHYSIMLDCMVLGLQIGKHLILSGERADAPGVIRHEVVMLKDIIHSGGYIILYFKDRLQYRYVRKTVSLNANVVHATHGETVQEVLGSGDSSQANQRFPLRKPPLTYVSAPTPSGARSTLEVRVDNVLWQEVPSLYGLDAHYIVHIGYDGKTSVIFGDGKNGRRLPSGTENVKARYRSGTGPDGEVDADSLTLLQIRPPGIHGVNNPLPATGAAPPETLNEARKKAPTTVLTMDRAVSLQDFEDFARSFAGIGKARAVAMRIGETQLVHLTIADARGHEIDIKSDLYSKLVKAIEAVCDPVRRVCVESFRLMLFNLSAKVAFDSRYLAFNVLADLEATLREAFSFERCDFGQPVTAAEVVTVIQGVKGVVAVDLDELRLVTNSGVKAEGTPLATVLPAETAQLDPKTRKVMPVQLLLINPAGIGLDLEETKCG
jgi:predicted phage baseplate assembly protein